MAGSDYSQVSSRIGDDQSPIGWQAACQGDVANWIETNHFVFAFIITTAAHTPPSETFKVQWSKNAGVDWFDIGGDIVIGASNELNEGDPVGDASGCGTDVTDSEEDELDNSVSIQVVAKDDEGEIQIALDPSNADYEAEYIFRLYSVTESAALTEADASLTIRPNPAVGQPYKSRTQTIDGMKSYVI